MLLKSIRSTTFCVYNNQSGSNEHTTTSKVHQTNNVVASVGVIPEKARCGFGLLESGLTMSTQVFIVVRDQKI